MKSFMEFHKLFQETGGGFTVGGILTLHWGLTSQEVREVHQYFKWIGRPAETLKFFEIEDLFVAVQKVKKK